MSPTGEWVPVTPRQGTLLVNGPSVSLFLFTQQPYSLVFHVTVGDMLERWSNDVLKSTRHRAVLPSSITDNPTEAAKTRRSVAYFGNVRNVPRCLQKKSALSCGK